jgi:hypothetical protein
MTKQLAPQLTEDEALAVMAKGLHAYVNDNGPDLEADHLEIPCDALPIETRKAKWAEARKQKLALTPQPFKRRWPPQSFSVPDTPPEPQISKGTMAKLSVIADQAEPKDAEAKPKPKPQEQPKVAAKIDKAKAKPKSLLWPEAPLPPPDATALERLTYPRGQRPLIAKSLAQPATAQFFSS